ncbi:MAG: M48 family metallopeptidase [Bacteroidales bacterium]
MEKQTMYEIHPKEGLYFSIKLVVSLLIYALIIYFLMEGITEENAKYVSVFVFYALIIAIVLVFRLGILIGNLKGNAIKISTDQFPDIYEIALEQSAKLGLKKTPDIYLLQAGGLLNAFATRFSGRNYVVIYSDILEEAYENNKTSVEFIIGHELGHIKRKHMSKQLWLFPSIIIPFLNSAYSRACEYSCDSIGAGLCPMGVRNGLVLLAAGKKLYGKVNIDKFIVQKETETGFWSWFAEKTSSHPKLCKRIAIYQRKEFIAEQKTNKIPISNYETEDHKKYMPGF